jgi:hypothetical protein
MQISQYSAYFALAESEYVCNFSLRVPYHPQIQNSPVGVTELSDSLLYFDALVNIIVRYKVAQVHSASNRSWITTAILAIAISTKNARTPNNHDPLSIARCTINAIGKLANSPHTVTTVPIIMT